MATKKKKCLARIRCAEIVVVKSKEEFVKILEYFSLLLCTTCDREMSVWMYLWKGRYDVSSRKKTQKWRAREDKKETYQKVVRNWPKRGGGRVIIIRRKKKVNTSKPAEYKKKFSLNRWTIVDSIFSLPPRKSSFSLGGSVRVQVAKNQREKICVRHYSIKKLQTNPQRFFRRTKKNSAHFLPIYREAAAKQNTCKRT